MSCELYMVATTFLLEEDSELPMNLYPGDILVRNDRPIGQSLSDHYQLMYTGLWVVNATTANLHECPVCGTVGRKYRVWVVDASDEHISYKTNNERIAWGTIKVLGEEYGINPTTLQLKGLRVAIEERDNG